MTSIRRCRRRRSVSALTTSFGAISFGKATILCILFLLTTTIELQRDRDQHSNSNNHRAVPVIVMAWPSAVATTARSRRPANTLGVSSILASQLPLPSASFRMRTTRALRASPSSSSELPPTDNTTISSSSSSNNNNIGHIPGSIPCPRGLSYLPFQREAILDHLIPSSASDGRKGILLGDEMGLGKTISIIGGINVLLRDHYSDNSGDDDDDGDASSKRKRRRFRALIVAPKSVLSHWEHELERWIVLPPNAYRGVEEKQDCDDSAKPQIGTISAVKGIPKFDCDIYLINYEIVGKYLNEITSMFGGNDGDDDANNDVNTDRESEPRALDVLVCDECHYLKSVDSQRTHATLGHHKHSSSQPGVAGMADRLWLVSGSPVLNSPLELFPLLNSITKPSLLKSNARIGKGHEEEENHTLTAFPECASLNAFRDQYCGKQVTPWGITYKGGKNLSELRNRLIQPLQLRGISASTPLLLRRTKQQVLPDLPDKRHQLFPLDDGGMAASEEFELLGEVLKDSPSEEGSSNGGSSGLEIYLRGLTVAALKNMLRNKKLTVGGNKSELIERLLSDNATKKANGEDESESDLLEYAPPKASSGVVDESLGSIGSALGIADVPVDVDMTPRSRAMVEEIPDLRPSALSALQTAPSESRGQILRDLLRVPRILGVSTNAGTNDGKGNMALLGALGRARHQTALRKVPYAIELLEIALLSHKVVVFAHHRDVQDAIFEAFRDQAVALNGDTPQDKRMEVVTRFQNDRSIKLFVGSLRAAGLGISLTAASHVLFIEMDWSPAIVQQAEDRCHRVGQRASVLVQYLFFKGTIDEHLTQLLVEKQRTVNAAIEEPPSEDESPSGWVFDFGKHSGKRFSDVAAENPEYLKWLVNNEIHVERRKTMASESVNLPKITNGGSGSGSGDGLTDALIDGGFLNPQGQKHLVRASSSNRNQNVAVAVTVAANPSHSKSNYDEIDVNDDDEDFKAAEEHVITFGKYKGKALKDIPRSYLVWVNLSGASKFKSGLEEPLRTFLTRSPSS